MANPNPNALTRFRPGDEWTGNAKGRPKGRRLGDVLREILDSTELCGEAVPGDRTVGEALVESWLRHAIQRGDAALIKEIMARIDGPIAAEPPQAAATNIRVVYADLDVDGDAPEAAPGPAGHPPLDEAV